MIEMIDFEIWVDDLQVVGYLSDCDNEPQWYTWDGFECGSDFTKTNPIGEVAECGRDALILFKWCLIQHWLEQVTLKDILLENQFQNTKITFGTGDGIKLKLYVQCSEQDREPDLYRWSDILECFIRPIDWSDIVFELLNDDMIDSCGCDGLLDAYNTLNGLFGMCELLDISNEFIEKAINASIDARNNYCSLNGVEKLRKVEFIEDGVWKW